MLQEYLLDAVREDTDDPPMTLQIGLVAKDGIVLAGDLRGINEALGVRQSSLSSKFCPAGKNLFAYSGGALAYLIAKACVDTSDNPTIGFEEIVKAEFTRIMRGPSVPIPTGSILAIVGGKLMGVDLKAYGPIFQNDIRDHRVFGDTQNAAIFLSQKYYRAELETADLLPLAVAVICIGGKLNPDGVQGLEVAIYKSGGGGELTILEPTKLAALASWADGIDVMIGQSVTKRLGL